MLLTRWTPFAPVWGKHVQSLQEEMNRLLDRWGERDNGTFEGAAFPILNVWEEEDAFVVDAELPGLELNDLEIYVTGQNQLSIKGVRKAAAPAKAVQHRQERHFGNFVRGLTLPSPVDENKVEARLENGVLSIRLPKHERAKPRKITIKT